MAIGRGWERGKCCPTPIGEDHFVKKKEERFGEEEEKIQQLTAIITRKGTKTRRKEGGRY